MKRKGTIVSYTIDEIRQMNREKGSGIDWEKVNAMTPEDIERLADEDDKRLGIDPDEWGEPYWVNGFDELMALHKREEDRRSKTEEPEGE
jgi:hypothetical protein